MNGLGGEQRMGAELTGGCCWRISVRRTVFCHQYVRRLYLQLVQYTGPLGQTHEHHKTGYGQKRNCLQLPVFYMGPSSQDIHADESNERYSFWQALNCKGMTHRWWVSLLPTPGRQIPGEITRHLNGYCVSRQSNTIDS